MVWDLVFYVAVGTVLGGRLGYVLFYNATYYLSNPLEIFSVWTGGMSFHGGLLGVIVAILIFARALSHVVFAVADFLAPLCAPSLMAGRIGNFINQELWGRAVKFLGRWCFRQPAHCPDTVAALRGGLEGVVLTFSWFGFFC